MRATLCAFSLAACAEEAVAPEPTACEGAGEATLAVGVGGLQSFEPWSDGSAALVSEAGDDSGIRVELLTEGLDTTGLVSVVIALDAGGGSQDALASVTLQCPSEGPGWIALFAPLPIQVQGAPLDGVAAEITATATDESGESASVGPLALVLSAG